MSTNVTKYGFNMREEDRYSQRQQVATSGQPCEGDEKMKDKTMRKWRRRRWGEGEGREAVEKTGIEGRASWRNPKMFLKSYIYIYIRTGRVGPVRPIGTLALYRARPLSSFGFQFRLIFRLSWMGWSGWAKICVALLAEPYRVN